MFKEGDSEIFDEIVYGIGGSSPVAFLQTAQIELDDKGLPILTKDLESSVPGIYVAGELSVPPGKGSIIQSFNTGKIIVEAIMNRENSPRRPELNIVH